MRKRLKQIKTKVNEPRVERILILLLPCLAILISALILAPRIISLAQDKAHSVEAVSVLPPLPTIAPTPVPMQPPAPIATLLPIPDESESLKSDRLELFLEEYGSRASGLYKLGGRLYYFNELHEQADRLGIDVSSYNHGIDWPAVKAQGIDFAIIRVGGRGWESGLIYDDSFFIHNLVEAKDAGIDVGIYFYSTAVNAAEALEEANYAAEMLCGMELQYPIFIDVEHSGDYPFGRSDMLDKATRALVIDTFCTQVQKCGYRAGVYSGVYFFQSYMDYHSASRYTIWLAGYSRSNHLPYFDERYDMWQYTDSGVVYGIQGLVDMNVIYG